MGNREGHPMTGQAFEILGAATDTPAIRISIPGGCKMTPSFSLAMPPDDSSNCIPWGIIVVTSDLSIIFANARARLMLLQQDGLGERNGKLLADRTTTQRKLEAIALSLMSGAQPSAILGIPGREDCQRYAIRALPCELPDVFGRDSLLVVVSDLMNAPCASRETIARIFTLSEREAEFAEHFSSGLRVATIAEKMGVALNTARVHLRHVLAKTGTTSQIELARMFARIP